MNLITVTVQAANGFWIRDYGPGGGPSRPPFRRTLEESCKGLGSVTLKPRTKNKHTSDHKFIKVSLSKSKSWSAADSTAASVAPKAGHYPVGYSPYSMSAKRESFPLHIS